MAQKTFFYPLFFLFFLFTINTAHATTETNDERALYALSSLNCHIAQKLNPSSRERLEHHIHFNKHDITKLWISARNSSQAIPVEEAQQYYRLNQKTSDPEQANIYLQKTKELVVKAWQELNPFFNPPSTSTEDPRYLLPQNHWLKQPLDNIFMNLDANKNQKKFEQADFITLCKRTSRMIVAKNKAIPGHLIKTYLESEKPNQTWKWMINRCLGAKNIKTLIKTKKLRHFTVPNKWIYRLPNSQFDTTKLVVNPSETAPAILVVTRMNIGDLEHSKAAWQNNITPQHLQELYYLLAYGLASCYLPQNIPYTFEGKFTCLDTEYTCRMHQLERVSSKLSPEMAVYWSRLVRNGGTYR